MAEQPEQMLPQHRRAAAHRIVEVKSVLPVELEEDQRRRQRRQRHQHRERRRQRAPHHQRHSRQRHARRAHREDRDDEVDRARARGDREKQERERVELRVQPGLVLRARERRVREPAGVRRHAPRDADVVKQTGKQERPEAERVESREGHVARRRSSAARGSCRTPTASATRTRRSSSCRAS